MFKLIFIAYCFLACILTLVSLFKYPGNGFVYIIFTIAFNVLLIAGFRKNKIFFDTFIGLFFWLGFWLKLSVRLLFFGGSFHVATGNFDYSGSAYDHALIVSSIGAIALIIASIMREKKIFKYSNSISIIEDRSILDFYRKYRSIIVVSFVVLFVMVAGINMSLGIYQRGSVPQTIFPFGFNGVYTWLLLFGLASISAVILNYELKINKNPYIIMFISLLETFYSNVSMLSRGMILNAGALILGANGVQATRGSYFKQRFVIFTLMVFIVLFITSVFLVNYMRTYRFDAKELYENMLSVSETITASHSMSIQQTITASHSMSIQLVDRWVGIEGVMAVSSYPNLGWELWQQVWKENISNYGTSFYDKEIAKSNYLKLNLNRHHFISLAGITAFFYYPGSYIILFISMFTLGIIGSLMEIIVYKMSDSNIILCSLMAQVIAYRYAHFGYAPKQSYVLAGAIIMNVILIYIINKICKRFIKLDLMNSP